MLALFLLLFAVHTTRVELGGHLVTVEIAKTDEALAKGLKGRLHLPDNHGMLFVFENPRILSFWMQDTLIPLSIGFFDQDKTLIHTADMYPLQEGIKKIPLYRSPSPAQYALEMPLGWFQSHQVFPGMKFSFQDLSSSAKMANHE